MQFLLVNQTVDIIVYIISVIFLFLVVILWKKNKKLKKKYNKLEKNYRFFLEQKVKEQAKKDRVSIQKISNPVNLEKQKKQSKIQQEGLKKGDDFPKRNIVKDNKREELKGRLYQANKIKGNASATSPISLTKKGYQRPRKEIPKIKDEKMNLNEFIKRNEKVLPRASLEVSEESKTSLKEIKESLQRAIEEENIALTSFEKEQEENAIISYQELLKVKDSLNLVDDEEDDIDFLEELKKLRNSLK